jgi:hypothetical protein
LFKTGLLRPPFCTGQQRDPINVIFQGVLPQIRQEFLALGWGDDVRELLGDLDCATDHGIADPVDDQRSDGPVIGNRLHVRLEQGADASAYGTYTIGAVHHDSVSNKCHQVYVRGVLESDGHVADDFDGARNRVARLFQSIGHRIEWRRLGNTDPISQCDGSRTRSDGRDAFVRPGPAVIDDNFSDNFLAPNLWERESPPSGFLGSVSETNQRLEVSVGSGAGGTGVVSVCSLVGSFDVQTEYVLPSWPVANHHSVRLGVNDLGVGPFGAVAVHRFSGAPEQHVFVTLSGTSGVSTSGSSGKLRLIRAGSTLSGYASTGSGWTLLGSGTVASSATRINLDVGTSDPGAGGVVAAFDNFQVNAGTPTCPA